MDIPSVSFVYERMIRHTKKYAIGESLSRDVFFVDRLIRYENMALPFRSKSSANSPKKL